MRNKQFLLLLLAAALVPYLITCFYALPFADDFCFGWTASEKISFLQKFLKQYLHWNGRYTSDVLVNFHPLTTGSLLLYQLFSFISVLMTPVVVFVFIRQWVNKPLPAIIAALFIALFYLCYLPNITEGVYWYIGLANYHWGSLCFIMQLTLLSILLKAKGESVLVWTFSLLLLVIAIGFNEIGAALIPAYYMAMLIYTRTSNMFQSSPKRYFNILIAHFVIAVIASAFVICSPGNFTRVNEFPDRFNLAHAVTFAFLQTGRFIMQWAVSIPFAALSLLVMINADKVDNLIFKKIHPGIWVSLLLFTVFIAAFIPYLATGILGQHRTMNYVFPFFIMLWVGALLSFSMHYGISENLMSLATDTRVFVLAAAVLAVMFFTGNAGKIYSDFRSGTFPEYRVEFMARQNNILHQPVAPILPLKNVPHTFQLVDVKGDTTWWVDKCMKRFYTETDIVLH